MVKIEIISHKLQQTIWQQQSSRWEHVGTPTRPTKEDGRLMLAMANKALIAPGKLAHVAVLGVTPEVIQLPWTDNVNLHAFDQSAEMIDAVWQPHSRIPSQVTQSYWQSLPIADNSVDAVVGDGCLTALQGEEECHAVLTDIARVLKASGRLVMRCFIRPTAFETLDDIVASVMEGRVEYFGSMKWKLAMALCDAETCTVHPREIRDTFNRLFPDRGALIERTGWTPETIETIDSYQNMTGLFTFPTMSELRRICSPLFTITEVRYGNYELSDRCPTIAFLIKNTSK